MAGILAPIQINAEHPGAAPALPSRIDRVLRWLAEFCDRNASDDAQRRLLHTALIGLDCTVREVDDVTGFVPSIDLPLGIHAAITGDPEPALPLAGACALVFLGLDIFDDLADGDRQPHWEGKPAGLINLAAATVLSALPPLIIARLDILPAQRARMAERLATGLLRMSAGQQGDLALTNAPEVTPEAVEAAVVGKSGEQLATYAALAAEMAGAAAQIVELWAEFGREIGTATQLMSDCHELLLDPECRDLAHGSRTLPVVTHLNRLPQAERGIFLDLLDRARIDPDARAAVRERIVATAETRRVMFDVQVRFARARAVIDRAQAREPGRSTLIAGIAAMSGGDASSAGRERQFAATKGENHVEQGRRTADGQVDQ